jgi:LysM repeat protein
VQQICQWNNIANPDVIYVGQQLTIYPTIPY